MGVAVVMRAVVVTSVPVLFDRTDGEAQVPVPTVHVVRVPPRAVPVLDRVVHAPQGTTGYTRCESDALQSGTRSDVSEQTETRPVDQQPSGPSKRLNTAFRVSMVLKGLDGVLEIVGGIVLLFVAPHSLRELARWVVAHDLAGGRHDFVARHLLHSANDLSTSTTLFGAIYLLSHGIAKVVLVVLLLRNKLWAYPWMIALLVAFIVYQVYRFTYRPGPGLVVLTIFDVFVAWLTWREYTERRKARSAQSAG